MRDELLEFFINRHGAKTPSGFMRLEKLADAYSDYLRYRILPNKQEILETEARKACQEERRKRKKRKIE